MGDLAAFSERFDQLRRNLFAHLASQIAGRRNCKFAIREGRGLTVLTVRRVKGGRETFIARGKLANGEHFECSFSIKFEGGGIG